jgi:hypothetical protein
VARASLHFFLKNEGPLRRLAPAQWGVIETILLRGGVEIEQTLADHLTHQQAKATARQDAQQAAAYRRLREAPDQLGPLVQELFAGWMTAGRAHWGGAFPEAECAGELRRVALRHFWFSLFRLARIHEKDALPAAILEDLRQCIHN